MNTFFSRKTTPLMLSNRSNLRFKNAYYCRSTYFKARNKRRISINCRRSRIVRSRTNERTAKLVKVVFTVLRLGDKKDRTNDRSDVNFIGQMTRSRPHRYDDRTFSSFIGLYPMSEPNVPHWVCCPTTTLGNHNWYLTIIVFGIQ